MATCRDVAAFLAAVNARSVSAPLGPADLAVLQKFELISLLTADDLAELRQQIAQLSSVQSTIAQESAERQQIASEVAERTEHTHSFLFRLEGSEKQSAENQTIEQEASQLKSVDSDLAERQQQFSDLLGKQAIVESAVACGTGFVGMTGTGQLALRDLGARMYRVSDTDFSAYWAEAEQIDGELADIATRSATYTGALAAALPGVDRSYLWAVAIGVAKSGGDPQARISAYLGAYRAIASLSANIENRLMAAEVLASMDTASALPLLPELNQQVLHGGVPAAASLGVAAILLSGRRADGSVPLPQLAQFRPRTPSYEAAALLAIINRPFDDVAGRFDQIRAMFHGWGYATSEDTELSSAYLAVSDVPVETVSPKLAIISRGMATYLQYPLVASAILASIPVLEANETLSLVEKAYEILGRRTGPMAQAELICLAVRMVHGIRVQSVNELDATAAAAPTAGAGVYPYRFFYGPLWVPIFVAHGMYYSTYSAIGGAHPAHVHAVGGGGWGGGGGVG
ncbi:MAG TPA: hypothetical protein VMG14_04410 [Thermoplasmata archaeon]|nr:hypothetical protein [Thermoplasmata archaeon]